MKVAPRVGQRRTRNRSIVREQEVCRQYNWRVVAEILLTNLETRHETHNYFASSTRGEKEASNSCWLTKNVENAREGTFPPLRFSFHLLTFATKFNIFSFLIAWRKVSRVMLKITVRGMHDDAIWNQIDNAKILYFLKSANSFPQWQKIRKRDIIFIDSENDRRSHRAGKRVEPDWKGACLFLSLENCRHMALAFSDDCHFFCRSNGSMLHTRGTRNAARIKQSVILRIVALEHRICCKSFSSAKRKLWRNASLAALQIEQRKISQ